MSLRREGFAKDVFDFSVKGSLGDTSQQARKQRVVAKHSVLQQDKLDRLGDSPDQQGFPTTIGVFAAQHLTRIAAIW